MDYRLLVKELWSYLEHDERLPMLRGYSRRRDTAECLGVATVMLREALKKSSIGLFDGVFYFFTGKLYEPIGIKVFRDAIFDLLSDYVHLHYTYRTNLRYVYYECENAVAGKQLEVRKSLMTFRNGVLDLDSGVFHTEFSKDLVQVSSVDYDYNPDAKTFLWWQFLQQVLPDEHYRNALQMFLGATFIDRKKVKLEKIVILFGSTGANGKSVIQATIKGVLGEEYVSEQPLSKLCQSGKEGELATAGIEGKRLNYCTEMNNTDFGRSTAKIKALVSGEKAVAVRKFIDPYYVKEIPLLMSNTNSLPTFDSRDNAMLRRLYVIPFEVTIPEEKQNKSLPRELEAEYPAILNWILEGRRKFIDNGYNLPHDKATEKILVREKAEYDSTLYFMQKKKKWLPRNNDVTMPAQEWRPLRQLYIEYVSWCRSNEIKCVGEKVFARTLEVAEYQKRRTSLGWCFGLYGGVDAAIRQKHNEQKAARAKGKDPQQYTIFVDGVMYVLGAENFAVSCNVGITVIRKMMRDNMFSKYIKKMGGRWAFEVAPCVKRLRQLKYISSDKEQMVNKKFRDELTQERRLFNDWSQRNGLPYRKYKDGTSIGQAEQDIIVVPDYFTRDEVIQQAKQDGYDVTELERYAKCRKENREEKNEDI